MQSDVFMAKLTRGAIAAGVAGTWMLPQKHTEAPAPVKLPVEAVWTNRTAAPQDGTEAATKQAVVLKITQTPSVWDKKLEREFRRLALSEVAGTLTHSEQQRLDELNHLRNRLLHGQTVEEISLQLKRDRLLERMESLLREYVEFQATTNQKRLAT